MLNLHWRQIINVPICRDFNEASVRAMNQRLHPVLCLFTVIYFGPRIPGSQIVCLAVMMRHTMIIFDTVVQQQLSSFTRCFPPGHLLAQEQGAAEAALVFHFTHHGATLPLGGLPTNSVNIRYVLSRTSLCCSTDISDGFS